MGFELNGVECLSPSPPKVSILLLKARRRFRVGCVDCVAGFVSIPGCRILWIVFLCCVDSECVDLVAGFFFSSFLPVGCVDSGVGRWLCG